MGTTCQPAFPKEESLWSLPPKMKVLALLASVALVAGVPAADPDPHGYGYVYHAPVALCKHSLETETKELCRLEPEKVCETKTRTYTKIAGYEKGDCKEIEVCKAPVWRKRRSADPHGYLAVVPKCEKETKKICKDVEVKVPKVDCGKEEEEVEEGSGQ